MARQKGSRNKKYDDESLRLAKLLFEELVKSGNVNASFRQLAAACDISPATLRHYFDDQKGAIKAALEYAGTLGSMHTDLVRKAEFGSVEEALVSLLRYLHYGWQHTPLGELHQLGLISGIGDELVGPTYLCELLEPTLQAFEDRIQLHIERGELIPCNVRFATLSLLSPMLLALLHQKQLSGHTVRPLQVDDYIKEHVQAFLRAYQPQTTPHPPSPPIPKRISTRKRNTPE